MSYCVTYIFCFMLHLQIIYVQTNVHEAFADQWFCNQLSNHIKPSIRLIQSHQIKHQTYPIRLDQALDIQSHQTKHQTYLNGLNQALYLSNHIRPSVRLIQSHQTKHQTYPNGLDQALYLSNHIRPIITFIFTQWTMHYIQFNHIRKGELQYMARSNVTKLV